ncbi:MAG: hypothetical protein HY291_17530 [Planctomycetes bacterium]|nr:hypothetical protein [Planctomycetota bacterium]
MRFAKGLVLVTVLLGLALSKVRAADRTQKRDLPKSKGHYVLVLPEGYDAKKTYEVMLALHGSGDTADNFARCWTSWMGKRDMILAVPEGIDNRMWQDGDLERITETLEDVLKNYPGDAKRVLLTGHSAGCFMGFQLIALKPDLFSGFGGTAAGLILERRGLKEKDYEAAAAKVSVYYGVGKTDPNHQLFKPTVDILEKCKFNYKAEDPDGVGHTITDAEVKNMLAFWDSTADRVGQQRLVEAKKLLDAKSWAAAEKALNEMSSGRGASAAEAKTLLENLRKDLGAKLDAAKALPGPDAIAALKKFQTEYPGTSVADEAGKAAEDIEKDPKTAEVAAQRKADAWLAEAQGAFQKAADLEKAQKFGPAMDQYAFVAKTYYNTPLKKQSENALARLKADNKVTGAVAQAEAERAFKRAEMMLKNQMVVEAKALYEEIASKYSGTEIGNQAKEKAASLR